MIAGSGFLAPVARRWKAQLNENGKAAAIYEELPEATHNTVVGFEQPDSLRDHLFVVQLKGAAEHPRNTLRATLLGDVLDTAHVSHASVEASGEDKLGQALSAIVMGDYVSVYLAFMYAVDPSPIVVIDHVKEQIGAGRSGLGRVDLRPLSPLGGVASLGGRDRRSVKRVQDGLARRRRAVCRSGRRHTREVGD